MWSVLPSFFSSLFFFFFSFCYEASSIVLYATKAMDRGSGHDHPIAEAEAI